MTFGALGGFLRTPKNPPGYGPGSIQKSVVALRQLLAGVSQSGRFGGQQLQRYLRRRKASTRWMSDALTNPYHAVNVYVSLETTIGVIEIGR